VFAFRFDRRNIRAVTASRPFKARKALGPRVSAADRGLTFGTSTRGGVCIQLWPAELVRLLRPGLMNLLTRVSARTSRVGARSS
jgi:hypothetical protein